MADLNVQRKDIVNLTCEFLETWFHQILYQREIYPRSIFELYKKFGIPVRIAEAPQVRDYLATFVKTCYPFFEKGDIKFVSLTIIENGEPVEKFVFEINSYLRNAEVQLPEDLILESESIYTLADLEQHFRACLIKINACEPRPNAATNTDVERTFSLSIEKIEEGYPEKNKEEDIDWIPAEITYNWRNIVPLKSVPMDLFRINTFIMQTTSRKGKERCP